MISSDDCIAMHIRHGDACYNKDRVCHSYDEYLKAAIEINKQYKISNIYLLTDSDKINDLVKLFGDNGFKINYNSKINRSIYN